MKSPRQTRCRRGLGSTTLLGALAACLATLAIAQPDAPALPLPPPVRPAVEAAASAASAVPAPPPRQWAAVPVVRDRLRAADIGLVINTADPYSVAVGNHYIARRRLKRAQVLRLELPLKPVLSPEEFAVLEQRVAARFGNRTQALALAWSAPYAVACNSITGALTLGFDAALCQHTCAASKPSPYANSASTRPWTELGLRPSMLIAAPDVQAAKALIDRGVAADRTLGLRGAPPVDAVFLTTADPARNVRSRLYPPAGDMTRSGVTLRVERAADFSAGINGGAPLVLLQTGSARVDYLPQLKWVPGGLGDHLTSYGG
ncbi:MAG: TIGR03790 family protein, partial [Rubrivivax sp.]